MATFEFPVIPGQRGLATTRQLLEAGATLSMLQHMVRTNHRVFRTVYSPRPGPIPDDDRLVAASLWAGPRSILTGLHALQSYGFALANKTPITTFLVPHTSRARVRTAGFETLRTKRMPTPHPRDDIRVAPIERALVDACRLRQLTHRQLQGITTSILQHQRTTADRVSHEIELGVPNATGGIVEAVVAFRRGSWSVPEAQLDDVVRADPSLPAMLLNPTLVTGAGERIGVPDGYLPDAGVVVQVHSDEFHTGRDEHGRSRLASTLDKDLDYQTYDLAVVQVAPTTLRDSPQAFLKKLVAVVTPRMGWHSDNVFVA